MLRATAALVAGLGIYLSGLLGHNHQPKPAYGAFRRFARSG
jgi:hypothetical protein